LTASPDAPALFHVRLAYELDATDRRQDALEAMMQAAARAAR
jgi:hypothetical protein